MLNSKLTVYKTENEIRKLEVTNCDLKLEGNIPQELGKKRRNM